jgi:hypothetical protein
VILCRCTVLYLFSKNLRAKIVKNLQIIAKLQSV